MRLPILFLLLTVMIDSMGIGLILPVMPELIEEVTGGTLAQAALWLPVGITHGMDRAQTTKTKIRGVIF